MHYLRVSLILPLDKLYIMMDRRSVGAEFIV